MIVPILLACILAFAMNLIVTKSVYNQYVSGLSIAVTLNAIILMIMPNEKLFIIYPIFLACNLIAYEFYYRNLYKRKREDE